MNKLLAPVIAAIFAFVSVGAFAADDSKADKMERQATPTARAKQNVEKAEDKVESKATTRPRAKTQDQEAKRNLGIRWKIRWRKVNCTPPVRSRRQVCNLPFTDIRASMLVLRLVLVSSIGVQVPHRLFELT
jgi:hypothetical protein